MPEALSPPAEDFSRRARHERLLVLGVCVLMSLLLHLMLVWLWSGYGGAGVKVARLRATFRSMPAAPLPEPLPTPVAAKEPVPEPVRRAASDKALQAGRPDIPSPQASPDVLPEDQGGGRLSEYVPVELLSVKPRFLVDLREYIPASLDASEAGSIVLQLLIGADGEVDGVQVESSELSPRGTRRFIQRLDALKLQPGLHDGQPAKARWRMEFSFKAPTE
ncbi:hypothetical protein Q9Q94_12475 [Uliginosibacterium sp. 31-16]|uniref:hypothetical protein n=1 Tax=Uliginosibacterium sp. 31-16 TaxID=3068315 RepID=UPI00273DA5D0|nr:hypothetical protein [Uliginosibacterium sp. 31-16]MDP5240350.1 hypothetical protein [Uliginosibacterium sp. 31-16]